VRCRLAASLVTALLSSSAPAQEPVSDSASAEQRRALRDGGRVGVILLGGAAGLAASTAAASSLIEALSRNDTNPSAPPVNPELVQVSGFVTVSLMSVSVGAMLLGGALLANDIADAR
jgi:hypothetical protein